MQKRRDMRRTDWKRILKRSYTAKRFVCQGMEGISSLILIQEITEPLVVRNGNHEVTIVDVGISWLQIALRDQHVWVTAMFDPQDRLLQIYFDITAGNYLEPEDNPTFEDLYLDIVMEPDGTLYVLDRDELDEALEAEKISEELYQKALEEGDKLYRMLAEHGQAFAEFCCTEMHSLKEELVNGTN